MSLATRCNACGTVFRVVQDQLKVSEGWVRCGRCDDVFNAVDSLFDLERETPPDWPPPPSPAQPATSIVTARLQTPSLPLDDDVLHLSDEDRIHSRFFQSDQDDAEAPTPPFLVEHDQLDIAQIGRPGAEAPFRSTEKRPKPAADASSPEFLQAALRKARWTSPPMRWALSVLAVALACGLALQAGWHFRDLVAARWPSLRPALVRACSWSGCQLEFPRRIDDISVESSALSPANGGTAYKLSVVLRNRNARLPLALPAIDLSLTDTGGQLVARRALPPLDSGPGPAALAPGTETRLQWLLSTDGRRVSGYTVEIFYP